MAFIRWLDRNLEGVLAGTLLAGVVLLISFNVFMRYVLEASLSWGEELTLWIFVWFVWLAASYAFRHRKHVRITVFRNFLGTRGQLWLDIIADLLILVLPVALALGVDPILLGVIMTVNLAIGFCTPPLGVNLFVASSISEVSIERLSGAIMPFFAGMLILLLAITFIPAISLSLVAFW